MKILVFSDSHGTIAYMEQAIKAEQPDHMIHLGDYVKDFQKLRQQFPHIPADFVSGNCDYGDPTPTEHCITLEGVRLFLTHGHRYQVKYMYLPAIYAALEEQAQILLFGHTHRAEYFQEQGLWVLNPGTAKSGSYGVIWLSDGNIQLELKQAN